MTTYFLIDGTNNYKVINEFNSEAEAIAFVEAKEFTENWENGWDTFEDFKDEFFTVSSEEMNEAIHTYGSRKRKYWN